jgi:hypothetical protein
VITIGKLSKGRESHHLDSVATGVESSCAGEGEAPRRWTSTAALGRGLAGEVERGRLRAVRIRAAHERAAPRGLAFLEERLLAEVALRVWPPRPTRK